MFVRIGLLCCLLFCVSVLSAQQKTLPPRPSQSSDTVRVVEILKTNRFDFRTIDSATQLQILVGDVHIRQGRTLFWADSVVYNEKTNFMQAYGSVHINDADSVNIYSQYMQYDGTKKLATFRDKVKLSDGNSTLYTDEMDYDMNGKVGTYRNGGRIESKQTTLYSKEGFYYADIKDIYFVGNVKMSDPEVALASDSLLYNTSSQVATFIAPTTIKSGKSIINTREGYYDLKLKKAKFGKRSIMRDSTTYMISDDFAFDDKTGYGEATGNVQYKDTAQGALLFANRVFFNKEKKNFLATEKPVMVVVQNKDSVYIAADTIYSGLMRDLAGMKNGYISAFDTLKGKQIIQVDSILKNDSSTLIKDSSLVIADSIAVQTKDTIAAVVEKPIVVAQKDSISNQPPPLKVKPVLVLNDSTKLPTADSNAVAVMDSSAIKKIRPKEETDTLRFITAFRHVRIFNDSLQAVADSLFYSGVDSVFQLFHNPVAWSKGSQVSGDTIFIFTENKKPKRLYVFENGLLVQSVKESASFFNQIKGRTINGYFIDGELDFVKAKGTAESIYYAQDDDSAFVGMNRTTADMIDMYFKDRSPQKVKFTSSVKGTTFPIRQLPEEQKKLQNFQWLEDKRPKNKLELFL
ncbi:OstA-like protein [Lacibacter sp.]|uniref:OstA-like protein n=1 Tax=Lacibacter sp. TaxID=1915409 RepID=UPI002B4B0801|nr:OstA-like protein [Lacibacter sp.]HLP39789.1 OstA-like protein [Lacibacter sp.]